jgi:hypothetical protein
MMGKDQQEGEHCKGCSYSKSDRGMQAWDSQAKSMDDQNLALPGMEARPGFK